MTAELGRRNAGTPILARIGAVGPVRAAISLTVAARTCSE